MNTLPDDMTPRQPNLTLELRFANGSTAEFYESDADRIGEALRSLVAPRLFAQPHLLVASKHCASMIPCRGIDMILVRTSAPMPVLFPLNLPAGLFDIFEQPDDWPRGRQAITENQDGEPRRRDLQVEIVTTGRWTVALQASVIFHGLFQDERQFFSQMPNMPSIPFRLRQGGFGVINTENILRMSAWPNPETFPGTPLHLTLRQ